MFQPTQCVYVCVYGLVCAGIICVSQSNVCVYVYVLVCPGYHLCQPTPCVYVCVCIYYVFVYVCENQPNMCMCVRAGRVAQNLPSVI